MRFYYNGYVAVKNMSEYRLEYIMYVSNTCMHIGYDGTISVALVVDWLAGWLVSLYHIARCGAILK